MIRCLGTLIFCSIISITSAFAGRIGALNSPKGAVRTHPVRTVEIEPKNGTYKILVKTDLEFFSIDAKTYADASAVANDLKSDVTVICAFPGRVQVKRVMPCKILSIQHKSF